MKKGLFVVLHGINNLGKTTQAKLLVEKLQSEGHKAEYMKYPVYDLDPSGKILNNICVKVINIIWHLVRFKLFMH